MGMTQEQLAELSEMHPTFISHIERGKVCVSAFGIFSIATALKMRVGDIICVDEQKLDENFELKLLEIIHELRRKNPEQRQMYLAAMNGMLSK